MTRADLVVAQARWILELLAPETLAPLAIDALCKEFDTPALRELAGETARTRIELEWVAARAFRELGLPPLAAEEARLIVARASAERILADLVPPYEGARGIWQEGCTEPPHDERLFEFLRFASEHEDFRFAEESAPGRYAAQIEAIEQSIVEAALRLLGAGRYPAREGAGD
jgi:hypothetical protein